MDCFLKIEGVDSESTDHKHKGEIEVHSWSWGEHNQHSAGQYGGAGTGKVMMQDVHFVSVINKASPKLLEFCATGEHPKKATLVMRKAGKEQQEYLKISLEDVFVTSYQISGNGEHGQRPTEQISLGFGKIEFEYKEQKADGTLGGAVKAGWNVKENKKV